MTHQEIIAYCLQKPYAYLDCPFGPGCPVVKVKAPSQEKGRIFVQLFSLGGEPKVTLNCAPDWAALLRSAYPGAITRGWHCPPVQQPHFNTVNLDGTVPKDELLGMIDHAYGVVVGKMPRYVQREIEGAV